MNTQETDTLRLYIREIESWPLHRPPSIAEIKKLSQTYPLSHLQKQKLQGLIRNHMHRYYQALSAGSYNQAFIELSRACILDPANTRNRVELAHLYLKNSPQKQHDSRIHVKRAIKLVQDILISWPKDPHALEFLKLHGKHLQQKRFNKRALYSSGFIFFMLLVLAWTGREWLMARLPLGSFNAIEQPSIPSLINRERKISFNAINMQERGLNMEMTLSRIANRNEDTFLEIQGRVKAKEKNLGALTFMLRAYSGDGRNIFSIPWEIRRESDPILQPGDSQPLELFHWLTNSTKEIENIEISPEKLELWDVEGNAYSRPSEINIIWDAPRPESINLAAEIRNPKILRGFDKNVLKADIALSNLGNHSVSSLSLRYSLPRLENGMKLNAVNVSSPPMLGGETRVWPVTLFLAPEYEANPALSTIHVIGISLEKDSYESIQNLLTTS